MRDSTQQQHQWHTLKLTEISVSILISLLKAAAVQAVQLARQHPLPMMTRAAFVVSLQGAMIATAEHRTQQPSTPSRTFDARPLHHGAPRNGVRTVRKPTSAISLASLDDAACSASGHCPLSAHSKTLPTVFRNRVHALSPPFYVSNPR